MVERGGRALTAEDRTTEKSTIFQHNTPKDQIMASNDLVVSRYPDGDIEIRIMVGEEAERDVSMITHYLSADEAEQLGRALCCGDDDTFDGLTERSERVVYRGS